MRDAAVPQERAPQSLNLTAIEPRNTPPQTFMARRKCPKSSATSRPGKAGSGSPSPASSACDRARGREPPPARAEPAFDRRPQSHVAGPVHVRRRRAPPARQQALHGHVRLFVRDREARLHAARRARPSGGARHVDRQCGGLSDKAAHHAAAGQGHQQPGQLRQGTDDLGHQPADARGRLGRNPRGRHRAAPAREGARRDGRAR